MSRRSQAGHYTGPSYDWQSAIVISVCQLRAIASRSPGKGVCPMRTLRDADIASCAQESGVTRESPSPLLTPLPGLRDAMALNCWTEITTADCQP